MPDFEVTLRDRSVERVCDAHAYQQEGQMTTFFRNDEPRTVVDSWSARIFSVRTAEVLMIRRVGEAAADARPVGSRSPSLRPSAALRAVER